MLAFQTYWPVLSDIILWNHMSPRYWGKACCDVWKCLKILTLHLKCI